MENNNKNDRNKVKWTGTHDTAMPPLDSGFILINGTRYADLKEDFCANKDSYHCDVTISIKFYCIEKTNYDRPDILYDLDKATIYDASFACCTAEGSHEDFQLKFYRFDIQKILKDIVKDSDWNWKLTDIDGWLSIDREGVYNHLHELE